MKRAALLLMMGILWGCDTASMAVVDNQFADTFTVQRAAWETTTFFMPVAPASSSELERTVPGSAPAWALLSSPTQASIGVRSVGTLTLEKKGEELHIVISATAVVGICGVDGPLSEADAAEASLIFPDELSGTYDPTTCAFTPVPDAGT